MLVWFKRRQVRDDYRPLAATERTAPGSELRQRPATQTVAPLQEKQEDNVYQVAHVGPKVAELVRPDVHGKSWGGYTVESLRVAGLARAIQTRLPYLHSCTSLYCLKNRSTCRFFFPWPYQPHQCFDENTERVALQRRCPEDDQFVVPHNVYLTMFSSSSVNVMAFDPHRGADHARSYATKYASKPEKWPSILILSLHEYVCIVVLLSVLHGDREERAEGLAEMQDCGAVHGIQQTVELPCG